MNYRVAAITRSPRHHFFGYYDMKPWDAAGKLHLCLEVDFMDRPPAADDVATIGVVDLENYGLFVPVARTRAWNFQQGAMMHWHPAREKTVLFNDRRGGQFVCVAGDINSAGDYVVGPAIADLSEDGQQAATLNFARIADTRPGYGYAGLVDPYVNDDAAAGDGLGVLNMETGRHRLVLSFADVQRKVRSGGADYGPGKLYFNHVLFNPSGTLLSVIVRWVQPPPEGWKTQLWTVSADGARAECCLTGPMVSHYDWKDDDTLIAWAGIGGRFAMWEFDAWRRTAPRLMFPDAITQDGHICYSRDRRRVACDTYPDAEGMRQLFFLDYTTGERIDLGSYHSPMRPGMPEIRCDFHPSFSQDDRRIAFDGMHQGTRQRYVVDLG
jgi:hypothetical protein